jgi:hypothetical protein
VRTRASAYELRVEQTPQFETIGGFDPYTQFLAGTSFGSPEQYGLLVENGRWLVKCGAIHGLPVDSDAPILVDIYEDEMPDKKVAGAELTVVGAQKSPLANLTFDLDKENPLRYKAVIRYLPAAPIFTLVRGDDEQKVRQLLDNWEVSKNVRWVKADATGASPPAQLEVEIKEGAYWLRDLRARRLVQVLTGTKANSRWALIDLGKMVSWERVLALGNPKSGIRDWVDLEMGLIFKNNKLAAYQGPEVRIYADEENFMRKDKYLVAGFVPHARIQPIKQNLYCYLLNLRSNYSITAREGGIVFRPEEHPENQEVKLPLYKKPLGWGFEGDENEAIAYFKLIVTTEAFEYYQLLQDGIDAFRFEAMEWKPVGVTGDWCSVNMKIHLIRQKELKKDTEACDLGHGKISIRSEGVVSAKVSLSTACRVQAGPDPAAQFPSFESPEWSLMDFSTEADKFRQHVLELGRLDFDDDQLKEKPLEIHIRESLGPEETIVAVAFDGQDFRQVGETSVEDGKCVIRIREIPGQFKRVSTGHQLVPNPLNEEALQHSSLYDRWKIAFFKGLCKNSFLA